MTYREDNGWLKIKAMQQEIGVDAIGHGFEYIDFYLDEGKTKDEIEETTKHYNQTNVLGVLGRPLRPIVVAFCTQVIFQEIKR